MYIFLEHFGTINSGLVCTVGMFIGVKDIANYYRYQPNRIEGDKVIPLLFMYENMTANGILAYILIIEFQFLIMLAHGRS